MSRRDLPNHDQDTHPENPQSRPTTGSLGKGEPVFIAVGFLRRAHGLHGEMIMDVLTDFPERLPNRKVFLGDARESQQIRSIRPYHHAALVTLDGVDTPEAASRYRNTVVYVRADQLPPLPEGEYYHHELLGLQVVTDAGEVVGILEQILETGANDVYLVRRADGTELLLPVIEEVILAYEVPQGRIVVRLQEWG